MEAQEETSQVLDFTQLDLVLGFLPDQESANILRRQFVDACRTVERAEGRVATLHAEAEVNLNDLEEKQKAFETERESEREAIRNEKAILRQEQGRLKDEQLQFKNLAESLGSWVQNLSESVVQVSDNVKSCRSAVTDNLEAVGKATAEKEEAGRLLNQDIITKLQDLSVSTEKNTSDLSLIKDKSGVIATAVDSVKGVQERIESSLKDGVTMEGIRDQIGPLVAIANTIKDGIAGLPTVASLNTKFANVGRLADRLEHLQAQAIELGQENRELKNQNENLSSEAARANSFALEARSQLEENEGSLSEKDSSINELQTARDDLLKRLTDATLQISQGREARRRLDEAQPMLQTAEANRQELAEATNKLQQAEQTAREMRQKMANLQRTLDREKQLHDACSAELTKALSNNRDIILQKSKLEDECSTVRNELNQLRSQHALDMKEQWATVKEALEKQLSDKRSHDDTVRELHTAWNSERQTLQGRITDKESLIERQDMELETLRPRVSTIEPLQQQLDMANKSTERVTKALEQANSDLQVSEQRLVESEEMVRGSEKELANTKAENESLRDDWESALDQVKSSNGVIERIEREHSTTKDMLSTLQAQSVIIPRGVTGELCRMYFRLADELRDVPTVPEINGELDMSEIAIEIAPLILGYEKNSLLDFLQRGSEDLHCFRRVIQGDRHSLSSDGTCHYHDRCLLVRVVVADSPSLEFLRAE